MITRDSTNKKPIMAIKKVSHTYPALSRTSSKIEALRDVSLELLECEFVCMLGPSGCGKSTLLHLLAGYMTPTVGRIMMRDREVTSPDISRGVVFQQPSLYPWLTCGENVLFGPRMRGIASEQLEEIRDTYLSKVNLLEFKNTLPQELSGGMRQRVALARSIANEPDVLLLDEPLGALDALTRIQTQHLLRELWVDSCKTIFMITHDIDEALSLATRIVVMSNRPGTILKEFQTNFTLTAFDNESNRVTITPEYVSLRDKIFDLIVKK